MKILSQLLKLVALGFIVCSPTCASSGASLNTLGATTSQAKRETQPRKKITFIVYAAADNNLKDFAARNIKQMSTIGSSDKLNILVHLDIRLLGNKKTTRRYYVEKNQVIHVNPEQTKPMDSGDPQTLISCCKWAIETYPAEHYVLIFWNHGTGIIDPTGRRLLNTDELYTYNPNSGRYDLDRTIGFLDLIEALNTDPKGICWDDSTGNYLTNQKLDSTLAYIQKELLGGKKFDLVGFDACLMSMLEVCNITKKYANILVGSEEVEPGPGWDYHILFSSFLRSDWSIESMAKSIVTAYEDTYKKITNDYQLSAIDLRYTDQLEENIDQIAQVLLDGIRGGSTALKNAILEAKSKRTCTHFDEPSYKDLYHFYHNLYQELKKIKSGDKRTTQQLLELLSHGMNLIKEAVIANVAGPNIKKARGISFYFPDKKIHPSYKKTEFAATNNWATLVTHLLL